MTQPVDPEFDTECLRGWIGKQEVASDLLTPGLHERFCSIFADTDAPGMPDRGLGIHWCLAPTVAPMDALGSDGHPARGLFLPPVPLPRRMWAGGELRFHAPLRLGETIRRTSTIADISLKQGRSGPLCFVAVSHVYETEGGIAIEERQDIVYREAAAGPAKPPSGAPNGEWKHRASVAVEAASTLLFRYSALTFNGHRIHYDRDYAMRTEFYDGLVVHAPLQATYALRLAAAMCGETPQRFSYRGAAPLIDGNVFHVLAGRSNARTAPVRVTAHDGHTTMTGEAQW